MSRRRTGCVTNLLIAAIRLATLVAVWLILAVRITWVVISGEITHQRRG